MSVFRPLFKKLDKIDWIDHYHFINGRHVISAKKAGYSLNYKCIEKQWWEDKSNWMKHPATGKISAKINYNFIKLPSDVYSDQIQISWNAAMIMDLKESGEIYKEYKKAISNIIQPLAGVSLQ